MDKVGYPPKEVSGYHVNPRVPSLGDPNVVETILRVFVKDALDRRTEYANRDIVLVQLEQLDREACLETAGIFIGSNHFFNGLPGWNEQGGLDAFLVRELNIAETDPLLRVATTLAQLLLEMTELANYAGQEGVLEEQWDWQVDATIETFRNFMLGIPVVHDD